MLPLLDETFATLPPHFVGTADEMDYVEKAVKLCFPGLVKKGPKMPAVLQMCLASVVYAARPGGYLRTDFPGGEDFQGTGPNGTLPPPRSSSMPLHG